jgi:hypothetical protein
MLTPSKQAQQLQPAMGAALLALFGQLVTAVKQSGDGGAISETRDAIYDLGDRLKPRNTEQISDMALNVVETLTQTDELTAFVTHIGWALANGFMLRQANKDPDGKPMDTKESK